MQILKYVLIAFFSISLTDCQDNVEYHPYIDIPLEGIITDRKQEISGMTTYQDKLILLPENLNGYYFYIPFEEIENTLNTNDTILPVQKTFTTRHLKERFEDFDGF